MIKINVEKAKVISHNIRREARASEFAPLDEIISKRIPGQALADAELKRQAIRDKYAVVQSSIDAAKTADDLLEIVNTLKQ